MSTLPKEIEEAITEYALQARGAQMGLGTREQEMAARYALEAAILAYAESRALVAEEEAARLMDGVRDASDLASDVEVVEVDDAVGVVGLEELREHLSALAARGSLTEGE